MKSIKLAAIALSTAALLAACSDAQEYEVTGEVTSAQALAGKVSLEFFEVGQEADAERESIKKVELDKLGGFTETVELSPESKLIIVAIDDADGDGKCSAGEQWAEAEVSELAEDGTAPDAVSLALKANDCP